MSTPLFPAAAHLATEIQLARQHLARLETALNAMQPLLDETEHEQIEQLLSMKGPMRLLASSDVIEVDGKHVSDAVHPPAPAGDAAVVDAVSRTARRKPAKKAAAKKKPRAIKKATPEVAPAEAAAAPEHAEAIVESKPASKKAASKRKPGPANRSGGPELPSTGAAFWLKLMGKRRHSVNEILDKAIAQLEVSEDARGTLYNRLNSWLYASVHKGLLEHAGEKDGFKTFKVVQAA